MTAGDKHQRTADRKPGPLSPVVRPPYFPANQVTLTSTLPDSESVMVSVAVTDWRPVVFRVTVNMPVPLVSVESDGSTAWPSLLVKWTVPP